MERRNKKLSKEIKKVIKQVKNANIESQQLIKDKEEEWIKREATCKTNIKHLVDTIADNKKKYK